MRRSLFAFVLALALLTAAPVRAGVSFDATSGTGGSIRPGWDSDPCTGTNEGAIRYNTTDKVMEFCNGTAWLKYAQTQGAVPPTVPAGSGYFVLTETTWDGNLGGLAGANAKCLTELTTNTDWMGYADANANGQLVAGKVQAWLGSAAGGVNNLVPLATYFYARVGDSAVGGAPLYVNSLSQGPYTDTGGGTIDTTLWSAANRFGGSFEYWSGRAAKSCASADFTTACSVATCSGSTCSPAQTCTNWTSNSASSLWGISGNTGGANVAKFFAAEHLCNTTRRLLCMVNP